MGGFLTRVLRSGMLPLPAAPRPRSQPLALDHVTPAANGTKAPKPQAPSPPPSRNGNTGLRANQVEALPRPEPQAPIDSSGPLETSRPVETSRAPPSPPVEPDQRSQPAPLARQPSPPSIPRPHEEVPTFVVPPGLAAPRPLLDRYRPELPAHAEAPATFSARRMSRPIGAAQQDDAAPVAGPSMPIRDDAPPTEPHRAGQAREPLRNDILRAEVRPDMPVAVPVPPRVDVTSVSATPRAQAQLSKTPDTVLVPAPRTSPQTEAATLPKAQASMDLHSAPPGGRTRAPARRDAGGPHLTVNSLNVQVVNEERPTRMPRRSERAAAPKPPEDWARFGRQHLRIP